MALVALVISTVAMWRMDFIGSARSDFVRMTDSARNAYVAKNLVEGRGYTTNDMPAALVGFYASRGLLHAEAWPNADRFPFTTFAIASLYLVTNSVDHWVGIALYNILAFTILIVLIYLLSLRIFNSHYSALIAVTLSLIHHGTYNLLYQKDADSVALTVGVLIALIGWRDTPYERRHRRGVVLGTLLAWLFLARPNVGMPFVLYFLVELVAWWRRRDRSKSDREHVRGALRLYGILAAAFLFWTVPYAIYSWSTWGSPFFSANSLYQLPLGTRLSLGGDTWWKYYGPERVLGFGNLFAEVPGEILWKVVSSWILTFRLCLSSYITDILIFTFAKLTIWNRRVPDRDPPVRQSVRVVGRLLLATVLFNFAILPLFGWAYFPWKQYLVFAMPWVWVFIGHALYRAAQIARDRFPAQLDARYLWLAMGFAVVVILLGRDGAAFDGTFLTPSLTRWTWESWILVGVVLGVVLVVRPSRITPLRATFAAAAFLLVVYKPGIDLKSDSINYFPISSAVQKTLRERTGLVSSLALQSEVSWLSDRKHIPVPENAMLLFSYHADYGLDVEDIYIESARTMVTPPSGPFSRFMPTLESYARLERYAAPIPGYSIVLRETGTMDYSRYNVPKRPKASTIYRLTDPAARDAFIQSPLRLRLGDVANAIHLSHGFGGYFEIDGRQVVAQTRVTRARYRTKPPMPWEDASVSFFLRDRHPRRVTLTLFAPAATTLQVYWNLDLDAYDVASARPRKLLGTATLTAGWNTTSFDVPSGWPRNGLNKIGVRASSYAEIEGCPRTFESCQQAIRQTADFDAGASSPRMFSVVNQMDVGIDQASSFFEMVELVY